MPLTFRYSCTTRCFCVRFETLLLVFSRWVQLELACMEDPRVPDGFGTPFATITDDDHTAWIVITASLGLVYSGLFGLVRALVSWSTERERLRADDFAFVISTVCLKSSYRKTRSISGPFPYAFLQCDNAGLRYGAMFRCPRSMLCRVWQEMAVDPTRVEYESSGSQ